MIQVARRSWYSQEAKLLCAATGDADPERAIRKLAAELVDLAGFDGPPLDPEITASIRNVTEIRRITMANAGRLRPTPGGLVIEVNIRHSTGKQNFTIGHETAHIAADIRRTTH